MTFDEFFAVLAILSVVCLLAGYAILRQTKPPTMQDVPRETTVEQKRKAWTNAQGELGSRLKRVK